MKTTDRLDDIKESLWELENLNARYPEAFTKWAHMLDAVATAICEVNDAVTEEIQKQ
jgi:hypothetical protein